MDVGVTGSIITGDGSSTGVGFSVTVDNIQRSTVAFIGADPSGNAHTVPKAASTLDFGDVSISATTGVATLSDGSTAPGLIIGIAVAGTSTTGQFGQSPDNPTKNLTLPANFDQVDGTTGAGLAGGVAINVINDTTLAYMNASGTATTGKLALAGTNNQTMVNISGGVALAFSGKVQNSGGTSIAGAFSLNQTTSDTEAFLKAITLTSTAAAAQGSDQVSLSALMEGIISSGSASLSAGNTDQGKNYALSVSVNRVVDTTDAVMDDVTVTQAGNVGVDAMNSAQIIAVGGGFAGSKGSRGAAGALGYNQIAADTEAAILGTDQRSAIAMSGDLTIDAENDNVISAIGVSAGVATGQDSNAIALTIGINIIASSQSVFSHDTSDAIIAEIGNADVTGVHNVSITATDNSVIQSIGGAFGIGIGGSGYGIGLSWNQVVLNVDAFVDDASVTATGTVSLTGQSTQDAGLLDGKISAAAVGAAGGSSGKAVGASVAINGTIDDIEAKIKDGSSVSGASVAVSATDTDTIRSLVGAVAISTKSSGFGAAIGANYIDNTVTASIDSSTVHATGGNSTVTSDEEANIQALAVGLEGGQNNAAGGSIAISVITDTVIASVAGTATVTASGNVRVKSTNNATIGTLAGQVAIGSKVGFGLSVTTAVIVNNNSAFISGTADVTGDTGVTVNANTTESPSVFAVGGSLGFNTAGIAATVTVTTVTDNTLAYVDAAPTPAAAGFVQGGTGSGSSGDVTIDAESTFNLLGTAGALAFGGKAGVGVAVDTGVVTRNTHAYVGADAKVNADGSVVVTANATETITSVSVAGAFSGKVAVGLTAGVSVLNLTTTAYVDSGAVVIAKNNVVDSAEDQTTVTLVSGNLSGAGNVAVGVGAGISVLTKNTDSYIASDAQVTALAQGSAIMANTGRFGTPTGSDIATPAANVEFTTANVSGNVITATGHGLNTGDEVVYDGAGLPLGGLNSGGEYYVIRVDADHFELAASYADAQNGNAIALSAGQTSATDQHTVERLSQIGVPSVSTSNVSSSTLDLSNLADNLDGPPEQALRQGVVVVAVSTNHMDAAGAAGGGAGSVAVQVAGAVAVHEINTLAEIRSGAKINQTNTAGANANQSVYVDAGRSYHNLTLGLGAAFSGTAAVSPSIAVPVLTGTTAAHILGPTSSTDMTLVSAKQDVEVAALAQSDFVAVSVGISGSGEVAIAGSVTVVDVNTTTEATINGLAVVKAGGNVLVSAFDTTTAYSIAGAVGIGIGAGAGAGAFAVSVITKNTNALIENGATVDADGNGTNTLTGIMTGSLTAQQAIQGVAVQAYSNEKLVNVAGSGAGGLYVGIAGAVDVEETNSNTVAAIQNGAKVNQNDAATANSQQAVAVGARNDLTITAVAGALAGGAAGIGAGVDVEAIHNNAEAFIAGGGTTVGHGRSRSRCAHQTQPVVRRDCGRRRRLCARRRNLGAVDRRRVQRQLFGQQRGRLQLFLERAQRQQRQWAARQHRLLHQPVDDGGDQAEQRRPPGGRSHDGGRQHQPHGRFRHRRQPSDRRCGQLFERRRCGDQRSAGRPDLFRDRRRGRQDTARDDPR